MADLADSTYASDILRPMELNCLELPVVWALRDDAVKATRPIVRASRIVINVLFISELLNRTDVLENVYGTKIVIASPSIFSILTPRGSRIFNMNVRLPSSAVSSDSTIEVCGGVDDDDILIFRINCPSRE